MKIGTIIFYDDSPHPGYPISIKAGMENITLGGKFNGMEYRDLDFINDNKHLKCTIDDIPSECIFLHQFQEWYYKKYNEMPIIYQQGTQLNYT